MINLSSILTDPDLGSTTFVVERKTYRRSAGENVLRNTSRTTITGIIHPGSSDQLALLPEEDRHEAFIVVFSPFVLSLGSNAGATFLPPDRVLWSGRSWRVVRVKDWSAAGFVQALAVLVSEEE